MIDKQDFHTKLEALEHKLQSKLGVRGKSLQARLKRAGRLLPKRLHKQGTILLETQEKLVHPKLAVQLDSARVASAFKTFDDHLNAIDPRDRRKGKILGWLGGLVFNLLILAGVLIFVLIWQDIL